MKCTKDRLLLRFGRRRLRHQGHLLSKSVHATKHFRSIIEFYSLPLPPPPERTAGVSTRAMASSTSSSRRTRTSSPNVRSAAAASITSTSLAERHRTTGHPLLPSKRIIISRSSTGVAPYRPSSFGRIACCTPTSRRASTPLAGRCRC